MSSDAQRPTRREFLKTVAAATAVGAVGGCISPSARPSDRVKRENEKPGSSDWMLNNTRIDPATKYRCPWIEGYCSHTSIHAGEQLSIFVSTNPASSFSLDVYRMGYYGGTGARLLRTFDPIKSQTQPDPPVGDKRLRECQWTPALEFTIPHHWLSGVYLGKLRSLETGVQSYVIFIVRDERPADFIFQCSDNTWQAYNRWPSQFSLYDDGKEQWYWGGGVQIGFNRPYGKYCQILDAPLSTGSGEFLLWEFPLAFWLEAEGYDVTYVSNLDTHRDPTGLLRAKGFLSVGHDEYWSIEMFNNMQSAIERGLNVAFLSGNAVCGRILFSPDSHGEKLRTFERVGVFGPPGGTIEFKSMSSLTHERPYANELMGAHSTGPVTGGADWICALPDHWLFAGTGMKKGEGVPGLVGWEWHGDPARIPGLEVVATGPTFSAPGQPNGGTYTATVYPGPKNNFVFNAATIWWSDGLSEPPGYQHPRAYIGPRGPDTRVQQMTRNLLARMGGARPPR
ncbi:MAG TPA: N,N-dimethylformamidase beta subunit family domain-containing protein [Methylomirabilota bacterium]|nr:N,N-dimethylformamidase beta subunit family domain-containing protein [Methylomirabilota bacterium]